MDEKERIYGERYPIDEDFLAALARDAAGERRRARLRPAGDAGDRRAAHRAGDLDAGGRRRHEDRCVTPSTELARRRTDRAGRVLPTLARAVAARYAVAITPAIAALIDRNDPDDPIARQFVPDAAELDAQPRGARRSDRRRRAQPGRGHRAPLSRPRAAEARRMSAPVYCRFCFRREMVGPGEPSALSAEALDAALAYIARASGDLGGDPHRRRSAGRSRRGGSPRRCARSPRSSTSRCIRFHTRVPVVAPERDHAGAGARAEGRAASRPRWRCTPTIRAS